LLRDAQIGKEKIASVLHTIEMLLRYRSFFRGGEYVARPRSLPHFLTALGKSTDTFRHEVRMMNLDRTPESQTPIDRLFTGSRSASASSARSGASRRQRPLKSLTAAKAEAAAPSSAEGAEDPSRARKHKRNVQRREQRKRARARARAKQKE
jgi:hypothetical protein